MGCDKSLRAFRPAADSVDRKLVFSKLELAHLEPINVPCGQCLGCRLERSRQWAIRCVHEASLYEQNSFITLTYSPEYLPKSGSLDKRHFQLFMKRLRKAFPKAKIRYFHCGEYGEKMGRPHYHACLFNFDFPDRELWSTKRGVKLYVSQTLNDIWGMGFATVGDVTFESAAYVARYITKKQLGSEVSQHYGVTEWELKTKPGRTIGVWKPAKFSKLPEYCTMSRGTGPRRRPGFIGPMPQGPGGIGKPWLKNFMTDVYPHDRVILRGRELRPPKYYDSIFELVDPLTMEDLKFQREQRAKANAEDNTPERRKVKAQINALKIEKLKRGYENA